MTEAFPIRVRLTEKEQREAAQNGHDRQGQSIGAGLKDRYGASPEDGLGLHLLGALGERAAAKGLGIPWMPTVNTFKKPDVGPYQVRTASRHYYDLRLHKRDADDEIFLLVTEQHGVYILQGWLWGREGKQQRYMKEYVRGRPAYFVPRRDLHRCDLPITLPNVRWVQERLI
jgi:hypothetical protein